MDRLERLKKKATDTMRTKKVPKRLEKRTQTVRKRVKPITLRSTVRPADKEQSVKEELIKLTKIVRSKYKDLQRNAENMERYLEVSAQPLVTPLKKTVIESIKQSMPLPMVDVKKVKKEETRGEETSRDESTQTAGPPSTTHASIQTDEELAEKYLRKLSTPSQRDRLDLVYGVRSDGKGGAMIGNASITLTRTKVIVKGKTFDVTPGLMELLFMQVPKTTAITADDLVSYKEILLLTNAHRQMYSEEKPINANRGKKYKAVIAQMFAQEDSSGASPSSSGKGIVNMSSTYTYESNVNTLVNRLRLLTMSKAAGHNAHADEILHIENLLRMNKIIL